ncbi:MAG: type III-A CRISPR-associated RAMP protein Csm5 [Thermodesulfobacteriota bacterium]|nr:type III-A CRISPR-associated RAMP protein Csm5 [Thermodesulfobacteriota bacterium]
MESKTYYLRLKVLSPIHIGCDEVYEPTGFTVDEERQELIAFEPADFLGQLEQSKLDEYSAICKKGSVESLLEIYKFNRRNKEHARGRKVAVSHAFVLHYNKTMKLSGRNIQKQLNNFQVGRTAFQRLNGTPYIPGSALKGAIRTAVLNHRSAGKPRLRVRTGKELNDTLAGGTFDTDPFRLIKIGDFQAVKNISQRIVYGINRKKRPSKKEARGPYQIMEVVEEGTEFVGSITVMTPDPGAKIPQGNQITFADIKNALNGFYRGELEKEQLCLQGINCDSEVVTHAQPDSSLLRVGRHSGAECVTVAGYRNIKIMQGPGVKPKHKEYATTIWLASESDNPNTHKFLKPFGWVALSDMTEEEIRAFEKKKKEDFDNWETEQQQVIIAFHEKAKELAHLREVEELELKKAAEEKQAREEELRKYPWRVILPKLDAIQDWGALRIQVLENSDFQQYQSENEVGEAVRNVAARVADANPKKWDGERDALITEWLKPSGVNWRSKDSAKTAAADNPIIEQIKSFSGPGNFDRNLDLTGLDLACCRILVPLFKKWKWDKKKKAKAGNHKLWQKLQNRMNQLK